MNKGHEMQQQQRGGKAGVCQGLGVILNLKKNRLGCKEGFYYMRLKVFYIIYHHEFLRKVQVRVSLCLQSIKGSMIGIL